MRPASQLSLLLFLKLAPSLPIVLPKNCRDSLTCQSTLQTFNPHHSTPTILAQPHFPAHQLSGGNPKDEDEHDDEEDNEDEDGDEDGDEDKDEDDEPFDNAPITPSAHTSPSTALSGTAPLTSAYLLSLANPSEQHSTHEDGVVPLPSMPTPALPLLRKLDLIRYWTALRPERDEVAKVKQIEASAINAIATSPTAKCPDFIAETSNNAYLQVGKPIWIARDSSDLLVVGIVVLFLGIVICVELVQKMMELRTGRFGARCRRGSIYLEDDQEASIAKRPFTLRPAPSPKYKTAPPEYGDIEADSDGSLR